MKLTNKYQYPEWVVKACEDISHAPGKSAISVSLLPQNPIVRKMLTENWADIVTDASDYTARLLGIAWHSLAEKYIPKENRLVEETYYAEVGGTKLVGRIDFYNTVTKTLYDFKTCKAYKVIFDGKSDEDSGWDIQLNIYKWLLAKNGVPVDSIKVIAMIKDWSEAEAVSKADYPQCDMVTIPVAIWSNEKIEAYIRERIRVYNSPLIPCTAEEMWEKPPVYAIMDPKAEGKAKRLQPTEVEAKNWIEEQGKKGASYYIKLRPGTRGNCRKYCSIRSVCPNNIYKDKI